MSNDSDETDPRLARILARDLQKEGASDESESKNEMGSESNSNPPLNAQACDQTEPTGTSYPTVAASGDAPMAAFQGSLPEYVQALQLMGFSREEQLKAVNAMFMNREAAARQQQPPAQQQGDSVPRPAPDVQQPSSSSASGCRRRRGARRAPGCALPDPPTLTPVRWRARRWSTKGSPTSTSS